MARHKWTRHKWKHAKGSSMVSGRWHRVCVRCGAHERYRKGPKGGTQVVYTFAGSKTEFKSHPGCSRK